MTPLATKLVFITSSVLGTMSLGSTAYLVDHPRAFSAEPARPLTTDLIPTRPLPPEPVVVPERIELEPLVITGSKAPIISPARRAMAAKPKVFNPCSDWRDMGPTSIEKGKALSMRRVRTLCD